MRSMSTGNRTRIVLAFAAVAIACFVLTTTPAGAAMMSVSATAPIIDGADIANLVAGTNNDKWWAENSTGAGSAKGQSFTTGSEGAFVNSITYQIAATQKGQPTKDYVIRVGTIAGTVFTELHTETATQDFQWNWDPTLNDGDGGLTGEEYMTWTFESPVYLSANTLYGIDIGMTRSTSGWQSGIPYIQYVRTNTYADGQRYTTGQNGIADAEAHLAGNDDRVFHIDLSTGPAGAYWDLNGAEGGAGGPAGTWDAGGTNWNALADGTGVSTPWTAGQTAVFAAGGDATGAYTVTIDGTQDIGGLTFEEGTVTISGGTALRLTSAALMNVASGLTATVETAITEDAAGQQLIKKGDGTLILSGANAYTGATTITAGTLRLGIAGGLPAAGDVTIGDIGGSGVAATLDLNGNSVILGALTLFDKATVDTGDATTLTTTALTYNSGTLTLGTTAVAAGSLTVNADLDASGGTLTADTAITVKNATLTVAGPITTQTLTLNGAGIVGGAATADTTYSFTNIPDYSADITGAAAELIIGEDYTQDHTVKLSGAANTYGGSTTINRGILEVAPDAANLGGGTLVFNAKNGSPVGDSRMFATILQTSGTFARTIGTDPGQVNFPGVGGFAATDQPLTVTLDGTVPGNLQQSGSPTSTAPVTITNNLTLGTWRTFDNPNSSQDISILAGDVTISNDIWFQGEGTLWLQGATTMPVGKRFILGDNTPSQVLRAAQGPGLAMPDDIGIYFRAGGGALETSGTFTRQCETTGGVFWHSVYGGGGFSAYGAPLTVSLIPKAGGSPGDELLIGTDIKATHNGNASGLFLGSATANDVVTFMNSINYNNGNRHIIVAGNPDSDADYAVIAGELKNLATLTIDGAPNNPGELRINDASGNSVNAVTGAIVKINGTATLTGAARAYTGASIGGTGSVTKVDIQNGGGLAPGNDVGTLTATGNTTMRDGSFYEWEIGPESTDILNITGGTLNLDDFVLKILDADGYVPDASNRLPVFTYTGAAVDLGGFGNVEANFDTSTLDTDLWDWSAGLTLTDDAAGTIYLTGLAGGKPAFMAWTGGVGTWNTDAGWDPVGPTTSEFDTVVNDPLAELSVTDAQAAKTLTVRDGLVDIATGGALTVGQDIAVTGGELRVSSGAVSTGRLAVSGTGVVNAAMPITVTDKLSIGDEPAVSVTGGSFDVAGADLLDGAVARTLTLRGGTVRIASQAVAPGSAVGVNFLNIDERPLAADDVAGVVPATNWNNTNGSPIADTAGITGPSAGALVDNAGVVVTDMTINWLADDVASTNNGTSNGDEKMMTGYLSDAGGGLSVIVRDVPFATYDVYAYIGSNDDLAAGSVIVSLDPDGAMIDQEEFRFTALSNGQVFPGAYTQMTALDTPSNWAVWTGLTGSDFEIIATADPGAMAGIHGLQIVDHSAATGLDMSTTTIAAAADTTLDLGGASGATFAAMTLGAPATLTVGGDVSLAAGGSYNANVSSATAGKLVSPAAVALTGTSLNVVATGGGNEWKAGSYVLVDAGALGGTFDSVTPLGTYVAPGTDGLTYGPDGTVTLTLLLDLNPGDANLDGATDVGDRIIWNNNNFTEGTTFRTGDFNNDGATDVGDRIIWNNHNFTEATAGPTAAATAADSDDPMPEFIYDPATGLMTVNTNGHYLTEIVAPGPGEATPEGQNPRDPLLLPSSRLPEGLVMNGRGPTGFVLWGGQYFRGKFQGFDSVSNGLSGEFAVAQWAEGLSENDFGMVEWGSLPVPGQAGVGGLSPVTVVPEPATMVLLGLGGLVALARRRRRK